MVRLEEDSESVVTGTLYDYGVAVVDVRLDMILVEVVFWDWIPSCSVVECREADLAR